MAYLLSQAGYEQICVVRGTVVWTGWGDRLGELQLWCRKMDSEYRIYVRKAGYGREVCGLLVSLV